MKLGGVDVVVRVERDDALVNRAGPCDEIGVSVLAGQRRGNDGRDDGDEQGLQFARARFCSLEQDAVRTASPSAAGKLSILTWVATRRLDTVVRGARKGAKCV